MKLMTIRGYTDRPSVSPGEKIGFHIDAYKEGPFESRLLRIINGDANPAGPGLVSEEIDLAATGDHFAFPQKTRRGGHILVECPSVPLSGGFCVQAFVYPTIPGHASQSIIGQQESDCSKGWLVELKEGHLTFSVGNESEVRTIRSEKPLLPHVWYSIAATYDPISDTLSIEQKATLNRVNGKFGLVVPIDSDCSMTAACGLVPVGSDTPIVIAASIASFGSDEINIHQFYNGKIDSPKIICGQIDNEILRQLQLGGIPEHVRFFAHWDFAANAGINGFQSDVVLDVSGNNLNGECINVPDRGMTGWNWEGHLEHFAYAPHQYGAIWFHEDSVEDCGWSEVLTLSIPENFKSGVYALEVTKDGQSDQIVFFVRPKIGRPQAKIAVLMPTFTYTVYENVISHAEGAAETVFAQATQLNQVDIELVERGRDTGLSGYEYHCDGRGCQYISWRKPILNMRPGYLYPIGATWNFTTDLHIISWLENKKIPYDIITDHDVHAEGADLLKNYNLVISGTHPEYVSGQILDAWEDFIAQGGRGMYLGGNGWYWVTAQHPTKPFLLEIRRGEIGDQTWKARPGEYHLSFTGERGGLWRNRARAPQKIFGTGYAAHGFSISAPYHLLADASDPRVEWIFDGVVDRTILGTEGLIGGGAVGQEFDRYDPELGSPPHALLLGTSYGHTKYDGLVPEEQYSTAPHINGEEHPLVRGDLVFFTTPNGGAMFAASSMTWATCLAVNGYDNDVSRVMHNVVWRFSQDTPIDEVMWDVVADQDAGSAGKSISPWS